MPFRNLNLLDPPFLARLGGGAPPPPPIVCSDYTPALTNLFTPYGGNLDVFSQTDVDLLAGFDGVNGNLTIFSTGSITDFAPLENLKEVTGTFHFREACQIGDLPMLGLRWVGGDLKIEINNAVTDVNGWGFNVTSVGGNLEISEGAALTSFGTDFLRRLYTVVGSLIVDLQPSASVSLSGMFDCFACADYTPGQATNMFTPYGGDINIYNQSDVDTLIGYDGIDGNIYIDCDTSVLDVTPLNGLLEITGSFTVGQTCDPSFIPMTGLRYVGSDFVFDVNSSVTDVDNFCFNLTRVNNLLRLRQGGSLTSFGTGLFRRLYYANILSFQLDLTASVSFDGMFLCFSGASVEFLSPGS